MYKTILEVRQDSETYDISYRFHNALGAEALIPLLYMNSPIEFMSNVNWVVFMAQVQALGVVTEQPIDWHMFKIYALNHWICFTPSINLKKVNCRIMGIKS